MKILSYLFLLLLCSGEILFSSRWFWMLHISTSHDYATNYPSRSRDGNIRYAARVNFDVACNMNFKSFPGDTQVRKKLLNSKFRFLNLPNREKVCDIKFESFGYTTRQMSLRWHNTSTVNENISLAQFDLFVSMNSGYNTDYYELAFPGLILQLVRKQIIPLLFSSFPFRLGFHFEMPSSRILTFCAILSAK